MQTSPQSLSRPGRRSIFESNASPEFWAAVDALKALPPGRATTAYAQAVADDGLGFARQAGLRPMQLTTTNVGKLLRGVPDALLAEHPGAEWEAKAERDRLIRWLTDCHGWMDHGELFGRGGEPTCLVGQPYGLDLDGMRSLARVADLWGLRAHVSAGSWHFPGWTLLAYLGREDSHRHPAEMPRPAPTTTFCTGGKSG